MPASLVDAGISGSGTQRSPTAREFDAGRSTVRLGA